MDDQDMPLHRRNEAGEGLTQTLRPVLGRGPPYVRSGVSRTLQANLPKYLRQTMRRMVKGATASPKFYDGPEQAQNAIGEIM